MMKHFLLPAIFGVASLGVVFAGDVKTDYDHKTDFGQYKTYSWIHSKASNGLWADRIMEDVDKALSAKGWTRVESGGDAGIAAFGSTHNEQTLETFYNGFGGGWYWRGFGGPTTTYVSTTRVGSLVVDVFDTHSKKLIWRGMGSDALSSKPEKNENKLEKTVDEMFKHFPPQGKG